MHRILALLLLAAGSLLAAPAPFPRQSQVWVTGWDRPAKQDACRFHRNGGTLTINATGRGHRVPAPRLLRDVEGDFAIEVRVAGLSCRAARAGLVLEGEQAAFRFERVAGEPGRSLSVDRPCSILQVFGKGPPQTRIVQVRSLHEGPPTDKMASLRVERRGDTLRLAFREGVKQWSPLNLSPAVKLPRRLKAGVIAEATGDATFAAVFDNFKLTPLGGKAN
jgi:hypothetical protein